MPGGGTDLVKQRGKATAGRWVGRSG